VSAALLRRLGIPASYSKTTQTAGGQMSVQMFVVSVGIRDSRDPASPELVEPDLTVMELVTVLPHSIEALIGLDILRGCEFLLKGPAGWFSLEF
jgi:hypothetical protein